MTVFYIGQSCHHTHTHTQNTLRLSHIRPVHSRDGILPRLNQRESSNIQTTTGYVQLAEKICRDPTTVCEQKCIITTEKKKKSLLPDAQYRRISHSTDDRAPGNEFLPTFLTSSDTRQVCEFTQSAVHTG